MSIIFDNTSVLTGASPWAMANFKVSDKPKLIFAYGLGADDVICVRRVVSSDNPDSGFKSSGCSTTAPQAGFVIARQDVMSCGVRVCMCAGQNSVVISEPGDYELIGTGPGITGGSIYIEATAWLNESAPPEHCFDCFAKPCEDTTWTATGETRCNGKNIEQREESNCGNVRWAVSGPVTWVATGESRCVEHLVQIQEVNDCGKLRWAATTEKCGYCPSIRLSCDGQSGYGFHISDPKDPAATVEMAPCAGDNSIDSVWIYPTAGPGHTIKVTDCDGTLIGYGANKSDCAAGCGC